MSTACEREARSLALEKAYVHQVYQQISGASDSLPDKGRAWPRVKQFLSELEPGSLVCDIGCGNGKYLNVNQSIFKIGADRCKRLTEVAREKEHEVLICDNLSLPFREESFDAVLSIAVVHHFATTDRRVQALRELAKVLKIGGKLMISVWAMEQRHRKFESQDVLVPWHKPQHLSTPSLEMTSTTTTTSEEDGPPPYHAYTQTSDSESARSQRASGNGVRKRGRSRHKGRSIDPARPISSSQSSSSLSSPNETCYSFVRRALQKLAGGKRGGSGRHRPWFLETWSSCTKEPPARRYDPDGCEDIDIEDIHDLPIELRRLEEDTDLPQRRQTFACTELSSGSIDVTLGYKSKSLSDILSANQKTLIRSQSSVPSLHVPITIPLAEIKSETTNSLTVTPAATATPSKPRLVKQKQSLCEEDAEDEGDDQPTDMRDLVKKLPDFKVSISGGTRRCVFKQSSMNEELMSTERLREKERVRQNIQKQASLNEEFLFRRNRTFDSIKDTFFSTSTAKRFQLLKDGLTSKLKNSTTGIEKVAGASFKNGFVRILQGWKSEASSPPRGAPTTPNDVPPHTPPFDLRRANTYDEKLINGNGQNGGERRHSREDGSDSSKDSSLQSDTSVDSEDSFASVIFIPKPDPPSETSPPLNTSPPQSLPQSPQPTSPKLKTSLPTSPKFKFQSPTFPGKYQPPTSPNLSKLPTSPITLTKQHSLPTSPKFKYQVPPLSPGAQTNLQQKLSILKTQSASFSLPRKQSLEVENGLLKSPSPIKEIEVKVKTPSPIKEEAKPIIIVEEEKEEVKKVEKPPPIAKSKAGPSAKQNFPLVRRAATTAGTTKTENVTKPLPKLMSLELFNPETDDMDSDSSGVSSPDSVSSVISVLTEELSVESHDQPTAKPSTSEGQSNSISNSTNDSDLNLSDQSLSSLPNSKSPELLSTSKSPEMSKKIEPSKSPELSLTNPEKKNANLSSSSSESLSKSPEMKEVETDVGEIKQKPKVPERTTSKSPEVAKLKSRFQQKCPKETTLQVKSRDEKFVTAACEKEDLSPSKTLLEAAADVANTLEDAVDAVIQSSPRARRKQLDMLEPPDPLKALESDLLASVKKKSPKEDSELINIFKKCEVKPEIMPRSVCDERYPDFEFCKIKDNAENVPLLSCVDYGSNQSLSCYDIDEHLRRPGSSWSLGRGEKHRIMSEERKKNTSTWSLNRYETIAKVPIDDVCAKSEGNIRKGLRRKIEGYGSDWKIPPVPERESSIWLNIPQRRNYRSHSLTYTDREETWDEECRQQLSNFADKLSEQLIAEIDHYREETSQTKKPIFTSLPEGLEHMDDPYLTRLSQELVHLTKLSAELKERNNYLASLSDEDLNKELKISPASKPETNPFISTNPFNKQFTNPFLTDLETEGETDLNFDDSFVPFEMDSPPKILNQPDQEHKLEPCSNVVETNVPTASENTSERTIEGSEKNPSLNEKRFNTLFLKSASLDDHKLTKPKVKAEVKKEENSEEPSEGNTSLPRDATITSCLGHSIESSDTEGSTSSKRIPSLGNSVETDPGSAVGLHRDVSRVTIASSMGHSMESSDPEASGGSECSRRDMSRVTTSTASLGHSMESSDPGDVSERTGSGSDFSRKETSSGATNRTAGSTASLEPESGSDCSKDARYADRRTTRCDGRSSSDETPRRVQLVRQKAAIQEPPEKLTKTESCETSLSGSTSQESLPSDSGGGAITFHRYYHVFREGELDQLIEKYVDNLHIISSYYDHANWCVIAEKVHVWTI